jgi:hypothetical protein
MSNAMKFTALGLAAASAILLVLIQFLPMESDDVGADITANLWGWSVGQHDESWTDCEDCGGTGLLVTGAVFLTVGLVAAAAAAALFLLAPARVAAITAFGACALSLVGFILWTSGYGDVPFRQATDAGVGFIFAIIACSLLAIAGLLGVLVKSAATAAAPASPKKGVNF